MLEIYAILMTVILIFLGIFGFKKFPEPKKSEFEKYTDLLFQLWDMKDPNGPEFVDEPKQLVIYTGVKLINGEFVSIYDRR